jgi:hypothetical protein
VEAVPHIYPRMLVRVGRNLAEEDNLGQVDKTVGGSRGSGQGSKTWR